MTERQRTDLELFKQAIEEGLSQHFDDVVAQAELITPSTLNPEGECYGDGLHPGYACLCEGCDYEAECLEAHVDEELLQKLKED